MTDEANVGWRERDWAKFNDDEREAIYGYRLGRSGDASGGRSSGSDRVRRIVWGAVAVAALAVVVVVALAALAPDDSTGRPALPITPAVLYGIRGSTPIGQAPGGAGTVCTEMARAQDTGAWRCLTWSINVYGATVRRPRPYDGQCAHAVVDQARGAWICLQGTTASAPTPEALDS